MKNLTNILESILLASGNPVPVDSICEKLEVPEREVRQAVKELQERYSGESGLRILSFNRKLQISSNPEYKDYVSAVLNPIKEKEFTKTILECAAIIAYKQPITKGELEQLRGLNCEYAIHTLLDLKMIEPIGRKEAVGRPILYATTDNFLKRFKLESISDLPDYDTLMESITQMRGEDPDSYLYANNVYVDPETAKTTGDGKPPAQEPENPPEEKPKRKGINEEIPDFLQDIDDDDLITII